MWLSRRHRCAGHGACLREAVPKSGWDMPAVAAFDVWPFPTARRGGGVACGSEPRSDFAQPLPCSARLARPNGGARREAECAAGATARSSHTPPRSGATTCRAAPRQAAGAAAPRCGGGRIGRRAPGAPALGGKGAPAVFLSRAQAMVSLESRPTSVAPRFQPRICPAGGTDHAGAPVSPDRARSSARLTTRPFPGRRTE